MGVEPIVDKWRSFGWDTHVVDGHDVSALSALLRTLKADRGRQGPAMVVAETVSAGVSYMESSRLAFAISIPPTPSVLLLRSRKKHEPVALRQVWHIAPSMRRRRASCSRTPHRAVQAGEPVVALTADLQYSNGLVKFAESRQIHPTASQANR
jgi:hypothetical protein